MSVKVINNKILRSYNPANLEILGAVPISTPEEIAHRTALARRTFSSWSKRPLEERMHYLERMRILMEEQSSELCQLITRETGKPLMESNNGELLGPEETCKWLQKELPSLLAPKLLASNRYLFRWNLFWDKIGKIILPSWLAPKTVDLNPYLFWDKIGKTIVQPKGVIAIISPWNFPFTIPISSILAAVTIGNTVVFKPSPKAPLIGQKIADLFKEAGYPEGVVNLVQGDKEQAELALSDFNHVIFTGGYHGGKAVARIAAEQLRPSTMELGGKNAAIVLAAVDVEKAALGITSGALTHCGQVCAATERIFVSAPIAPAFTSALVRNFAKLRLGNGLDRNNTDVGPLIDLDHLNKVASQVEDARQKGGHILTGGRIRRDIGPNGYFYEPTIITNVNDDMRVVKEEIFGPVVTITVVEDEREAIRLAEASPLRLAASIWTADLKRGEELAAEAPGGVVAVNSSGIYAHICPAVPWGGYNDSGYGTTHSTDSLSDFVNKKYISINSQKVEDWNYPYCNRRLTFMEDVRRFLNGPRNIFRKSALLLSRIAPNWLLLRRSLPSRLKKAFGVPD